MSPIARGQFGSVMVAVMLLQTEARQVHPQSFRFERSIAVAKRGSYCAVLDAQVFAHAASSLKDLRLTSEGREVPYAITVSEPSEVGNEAVAVLNLHEGREGSEFDLAMPDRAYSEIRLALAGKDFVAKVNVSGSDDLRSLARVPLGEVSVFDLASRGLARQTTLQLPESSFRYLHIRLRGSKVRVQGVEVLPSRERQSLYTSVAENRTMLQRGSETIARFELAAHVPIERASVQVSRDFTGNFSREVRITAKADTAKGEDEVVTGTILRVRSGSVRAEETAIPASLGANLQANAQVEVAIENGDRSPLPISSVTLAMRQRTICFDAVGAVLLHYGDAALPAPDYRYEPAGHLEAARLGPEEQHPEVPARRLDEAVAGRRPEPGWLGLAAFAALIGTVVLWVAKRRRRRFQR